MAAWADIKIGLKFGEVMHSTIKHRRRCCCVLSVDSHVYGGDDHVGGLVDEVKIKSNKQGGILYSD